MLRKTYLGLLLAPLLTLLAGCCANAPCNCNDSLADSLFFAFDPTFTDAELATVYVARRLKGAGGAALDSLPLLLATRKPTDATLAREIDFKGQNTRGLLVINNSSPFSQNSTVANLSGYQYRIYIPVNGNPTAFYIYKADNISLVGRFIADGCCTCYRNSLKKVTVTGGRNTAQGERLATDDASGSSGRRTPVVIQLLN